MEFFASAIETLKVLVIALGAGLGVWGVINLLEGYGNDNPGAKGHGFQQKRFLTGVRGFYCCVCKNSSNSSKNSLYCSSAQ